MTDIYMLWYHVKELSDDEDDVIAEIGYFSSEEKAWRAAAQVKDRPVFRNPLGSFRVQKETLDKVTGWSTGFVTFKEAMDALDDDVADDSDSQENH
jgi:hypothetical protein